MQVGVPARIYAFCEFHGGIATLYEVKVVYDGTEQVQQMLFCLI